MSARTDEAIHNAIREFTAAEFIRRILRRYPDGVDSRIPNVVAGDVFPLIELLREVQRIGRPLVGTQGYEGHPEPFRQLGAVVDRIDAMLGEPR